MKNWKALAKNILCVALTFALCVVAFSPQAVRAATKTGSVTFSYELSGCTFRLYYIGTYTDSENFELTDDFENTAVSRVDIAEGNWFTLALTLDTIVLYADIAATAEGQTDANGEVTFSGLQEGIYLMTADTMTVDGTTYTVTPMIIQMPGYFTDGTYEYDRNITITKYDTEVKEEYTEVSVQKVWDDEDSDERPDSIEVYLLKGTDGTVADTVTLSDANNWRYTWSNLDASTTWRVAEEDMEEYGVSYEYTNGVIVITNQQGAGRTYNPGHTGGEDTEYYYYDETETAETEETEDTEDEGGSSGYPHVGDEDGDDMIETESTEEEEYTEYDETETEGYDSEEETETEDIETDDSESGSGTIVSTGTDSNETPSSGSNTSTGSTSSSKLPQTGLDWGPAAYLVLAAALCFLIGVVRSRMDRKDEG